MKKILLCSTVAAVMALVGCQKTAEDTGAPVPGEVQESAAPGAPSSEDIKGVENPAANWKEIKLALIDKESGEETLIIVPIGGESVSVEAYKIKIKCMDFLPDFIMNGSQKVSRSLEINNPAAQVLIEEEGKSAPFEGWIFAKYPTMHAPELDKVDVRMRSLIAKDGKEEVLPEAGPMPAMGGDSVQGGGAMPAGHGAAPAAGAPAGAMPAGHGAAGK